MSHDGLTIVRKGYTLKEHSIDVEDSIGLLFKVMKALGGINLSSDDQWRITHLLMRYHFLYRTDNELRRSTLYRS